jgi:LysR family hca operon transcriptional activator
MELRHLRYFVAAAEEGSLTLAAEKRLHTAQPSLSRQIRDLEYEVGVQLLTRSVHGIELTAAGKAFLDHARPALTQADAAVDAARRAVQPARKTFAIGFQTGHEMNWLPRAMHVLRDELKNIEVTISSDYSPDLADALVRGRLDVAFLRVEANFDLCLGAKLCACDRFAYRQRAEGGRWNVLERAAEGADRRAHRLRENN